jgi:DNA-binding CsgD family transcriptional regulator
VDDEREAELLDLLTSGHPPAVATDTRDRIVFCNSGAAEILGRRPDEVLGTRCYETLAGRDVFGNRFCYENCPVKAGVCAEEPLAPFELSVCAGGEARRSVDVTIIQVPGVRADLYALVHILQPIDQVGRLARALEQLDGKRIAAAWDAQPTLSQPPSATEPPLTKRERQILRSIAGGLPNKEVARKLGVSLPTVRNHVHNILEKLGVHSKLEAISLAFGKGWIRPEGPDPGRR